MGLSRRKFTREFKEAAVRRLELGASVAEVARTSEVNPSELYRWRRELREFGAKAFTGPGRSRDILCNQLAFSVGLLSAPIATQSPDICLNSETVL